MRRAFTLATRKSAAILARVGLLWEGTLVSAIRSLLVGSSCALVLVALVVAPNAARAASDGVPPIAGTWKGKLNDVYWDQTSLGSVHPKKKFKSNVDVTIAQTDDQVTITINFQDPFPLNSSAFISQVVLTGYAGNYHVNASMDAGPAMTLSGAANKKGTKLTLEGVAASTEFTHELVIKLNLQNP